MASSLGRAQPPRVCSRATHGAPICLEEASVRLVRINDEPAQSGKAIQAKWTTRHELAALRALIVKAKKQGDLRRWRRAKAVRAYINGKKVLAIAAELEVVRASVNQWLGVVRHRRRRGARATQGAGPGTQAVP